MNISIQVRMKSEYIYDMLLHHMYSRLPGFLINMTGLTLLMTGGLRLRAGSLTQAQTLGYAAAGIAVLIYTPLSLKARAAQMMASPKYQKEIRYQFNTHGIIEYSAGQVSHYQWVQIERVLSTPKDIVFYTQDSGVLIFPKESIQEHFMELMKLIVTKMTHDQVYIR